MLWDRMEGRLASVPQGPIPLGRFQIPQGPVTYLLNGRVVHPGDPIACAGRSWRLSTVGAAEQQWAGGFGHDGLPEQIVVENVVRIAEELDRLDRSDTGQDDWLTVSHLVGDTDERLRTGALETKLRQELGHLRKVCADPHARLRTEHLLVQVSQARRITSRTVVHLSAHSETWARRTLDGVQPAHLLTPVQAADLDLYENRVVAALVERVWRHLLGRIAELQDIEEMLQDILEYLEDVRHYRWQDQPRLYAMLNDAFGDKHYEERVDALLREVTALRGVVAPLRNSQLCKGVRRRHEDGPARSTNLFVNDLHYRRCRDLWNTWVGAAPGTTGAPEDPSSQWCRSFNAYGALLVLRAFDQMDAARTVAQTLEPGRGWRSVDFDYLGDTIRLQRNDGGTLELSSARGPLCRVVPVPHALTADSTTGAVMSWLTALEVPAAGPPIVVLYPGSRSERRRLPLSARLEVHRSRQTSRAGQVRPAMVPVSPLEIDSVSRVARALRDVLDSPALLEYPVRVPCPRAFVPILAEQLDWVEAGEDELVVTRLPTATRFAALPVVIDGLRTRTDRFRQRGDNSAEVRRLSDDLHRAVAALTRIARCPTCRHESDRPDLVLKPRDVGYRCTCENCGSVWEVRQCVECRERYPVLTPAGSAERTGGDGDHLDRVFSHDLLAVPCWKRPRGYLCPACDRCGERGRAGCARCDVLG